MPNPYRTPDRPGDPPSPPAINRQIIAAADDALPTGTNRQELLLELWIEHSARLSPVNVATFLHRYAKVHPPGTAVNPRHLPVLHEVDDRVERMAQKFDAQGHVSLACAYVQLNRAPTPVLRALANHAFRPGTHYNEFSLASLVHAHAVLHSPGDEFARQACAHARALGPSLLRDPGVFSRIVWGLSCRNAEIAREFVQPHLSDLHRKQFSVPSLFQLYQAGLALGVADIAKRLPQVAQVRAQLEALPRHRSPFQEALLAGLAELGHQPQVHVIEGPYRLFAVVPSSNGPLVIEPAAFVRLTVGRDGETDLSGNELMRNRVLELQGYRPKALKESDWVVAQDPEAWIRAELGKALAVGG